jgi:ATP-dependent Clp protease ATP-binding subunit ClpC
MYERFTDRSRKMMALANLQAQQSGQRIIDTEHVLLGLLQIGNGVGADTLRELRIDPAAVRAAIQRRSERPSAMLRWWRRRRKPRKLPQTVQCKKIIEEAIEQARQWGHRYIGSEHMLMGLIREPEGLAGQVLRDAGATADRTGIAVLRLLERGTEQAHTEEEEGKCGSD